MAPCAKTTLIIPFGVLAPLVHTLGGAALVLLGTIVLVLGVFAVGVLLLMRSHRSRITPDRRRASPLLPDAWQEAGRRLTPPDEPPSEGIQDH